MTNYKNDHLATLKRWVEEGIRDINVNGLSGSAQSYFLSGFLSDFQKPFLIVLPDRKDAEKIYKELRFFMSGKDVRLYEFPPYDISPLTGLSPLSEVVTRRVQSLYALMSNKSPVVITSLEAVLFRILPKKAFVQSLDYFETGESIDRDIFLRKLEITGYHRVSLTEEKGDYSVRGSVIDIFSPLYPLPVRLEFWGDHLESIRQFDPVSQRSQNHLKEMILLPANEIIMDKDNIKRARTMGRLPKQPEESMGFPGQEAWLNHFYPQPETLIQYLSKDGLIAIIDPHRTEHIFQKITKKYYKDVERFRNESAEKGVPFPEVEGLFVPFQEMAQQFGNHQRISFSELDLASKDAPQKTINISGKFQLDDDLDIRLAAKGKISLAPLADKISEWLASYARVTLISRTEQQANRLKDILENYEVFVDQTVRHWSEISKHPGLSLCLGQLSKGFTWPELGLYVVSEDEIFGPKKTRTRRKRKRKESLLTRPNFSQLEAGDFVVHEEHGIGRYIGLTKMEIHHNVNDFVIVDYSKNDRLYIPADRISVLQKYAGAQERNPKLDQLGGHSWSIAKQKAKKSVKIIAKQLVQIYALRKYRKGYAFSQPDNYYREFEASFEYEETPDQIKAIEDVLEDMTSDQPMDRLICGDVGFGKTEVAIRAAFKAVSDGKQTAFLVPTTVLAEQHYETLKKRMAAYSVNIGILSRFRTRSEQIRILGKLRSGEINVLIGTHRIIQKDVKFANLGLLIIDEEHRFGVRQKETLKRYRATVDVLAITATPIPRTLQMSMTGVRDLSIIETPPEDRLAIQTYLSPYDESLIVRALKFELERGGQIFFVHNRVQTIDHVTDHLRQLVPHARFGIAHGQMKAKDLENVMMRFLQREIDVLVCTTIIESGLDIPSTNTIIINEVDRFGLAQIYQLRGRVGRSNEKAYAYLLLSNGSRLTKDAEKRLKVLMDFSHLGAGLHLALHDLRIRGGGNILGFSQSGHISAVGYELYLKFIERAIAELKGDEWHDDINPEININLPAFLPGDYVIDTDVRLSLYRRLSSLFEKSELDEMMKEIQDRFGPLPQEAQNLLGLMSIRLVLKNMGIIRLDVEPNSITLNFSQDTPLDPENIVQLTSARRGRFHFLSQTKLRINIGPLSFPKDLSKVKDIVESLTSD